MNEVTAALNFWAAAWASAIGRACWQGGLAISLAWVLCRLLPRLSGRLQCWLWRLAYLKLLAALLWAVPLKLPVLAAQPQTQPSPAEVRAPPGESLRELGPAASPDSGVVPEPARRLDPLAWLLVLWLPGAGWCGAQLYLSWRRSRRLRTAGVTVHDDSLLVDHRALCNRLGIRPVPALLTADELSCPVLVGVGDPAVVLPASFSRQFEPAQLRLMLAHELAHLKRRDLLWAWLPNIGRVLFFFHPLVWLAEREWRLAQEVACDEQVLLSTGASPAQYGALLLEIIEEVQRDCRPGLLTVGVAGSCATVKRRLVAIRRLRAAAHRGRRGAAVVPMVTGALLAVGAVIGIVPWRLTARAVRETLMTAVAVHERSLASTELESDRRVGGKADRTAEGVPHAQPRLGTVTNDGDGAGRPSLASGPRAEPRVYREQTSYSPLNAAVPDRKRGVSGGPRTSGAFSSTNQHPQDAGKFGLERNPLVTSRPRGERSEAVPGAVATAEATPAVREKSLATAPMASSLRSADPPAPSRSRDELMNRKVPRPDEDGLLLHQKVAFVKSEEALGVLHTPKPLVDPAAFMGWRRYPLSGRSKELSVRVVRLSDQRDLKKMIFAAQRGEPVDPRAFKEVLAWARPEDVGDGRVLKKLLAQMAGSFVPDPGFPDGKPLLLEPRQKALFDHQLEEKKHEARVAAVEEKKRLARDAATKEQDGMAADDRFAPDD